MTTPREKIQQFLIENFLFGAADKLGDDDESLVRTGIIDSTGVLELVAFLESSWGISVHDTEIVPENFDSINRLIEYVRRKTQEMSREPS